MNGLQYSSGISIAGVSGIGLAEKRPIKKFNKHREGPGGAQDYFIFFSCRFFRRTFPAFLSLSL